MTDDRRCIEPGCNEPAGTPWSPLWCPTHDAERIERITRAMERIAESFQKESNARDN